LLYPAELRAQERGEYVAPELEKSSANATRAAARCLYGLLFAINVNSNRQWQEDFRDLGQAQLAIFARMHRS
jgi:hypothetical protein